MTARRATIRGESLRCDRHGDGLAGFIVCTHVMLGAPVAHYLEPTGTAGPRDLGEALCGGCHAQRHHDPAKLKLICAGCLRQLLGERT